MRFVVTGASGYIGTRFIHQAQHHNHLIIAATRRPLDYVNQWLPFDLHDSSKFTLENDVDAVIHLAADTLKTDKKETDEVTAAKRLIDSANEADAKVIFVSSQTARNDAPTSYGRVKWTIEQAVLKSGGMVVRLGQVYGGPELGLFGEMAGFVRRLPVLPAFIPPPLVQPIHVDDCAAGLLRLAEMGDVESGVYCLASPEPVTFTEFVRSISRNRVRRYRLFVPVPVVIFKLLILLVPKLSIKYGLNRLNSLLRLPLMKTAPDLEMIGLELRSLNSGMHRSGSDQRRRLIQEGTALLAYILKERPCSELVRRYVRMVEELHDGASMSLPSIMIRWPVILALLDNKMSDSASQVSLFNWRLDAATVIAEASTQGACRFLGPARPAWRITALLRMMLAVFIEIFWRILRLFIPASLIRIS